MDDIKRMLRAVINGQSALKQELLHEIKKVDNKVEKLKVRVDKGFKGVDKRFQEVNDRLDMQGKSLAYLEDLPAGRQATLLRMRNLTNSRSEFQR